MGKPYTLNENISILRKCKECKKEYPQSAEFFWKNSGRKDGLEYICKSCSTVKKDENYGRYYKYRSTINYIENTQICKECKKELPLTPEYFGRRRDHPSGYERICKKCVSNRSANLALKSQKLNNENLWTCTSCGKDLLLTKENFYKRTDSITGFSYRCKTCVQKDPCRYERYTDSENLELYIRDLLQGIKSRTKKKNILFGLTKEFLLQLFNNQSGKCAISGEQMTWIRGSGRIRTNISVDRIIPNLGYVADNIQLVCNTVNTMKSDMSIQELKYFCKLILQNNE